MIDARHIEISHLVVKRGRKTALDDVSLTLDRGPTVLLGPNGAGKSTLIEALLGDLRVSRGSIRILGLESRSGRRANARHIGWLPQDPRLDLSMRACEMVTYAAWLKGLAWPDATAHALRALSRVDLTQFADARAQTLSGGQRRRLAIATAIAHEPEILLLDEPMNGLDPEQRREVRAAIREYSQHACVVVATHILQDLAEIGGRIALLNHGSLAFSGTVESFIAESASSAVSDLEATYLRKIGREP